MLYAIDDEIELFINGYHKAETGRSAQKNKAIFVSLPTGTIEAVGYREGKNKPHATRVRGSAALRLSADRTEIHSHTATCLRNVDVVT